MKAILVPIYCFFYQFYLFFPGIMNQGDIEMKSEVHEELQIKDEPIDQFSVLPSTENTNMTYKDLHVKSETNNQEFKCEICDKSFASQENRKVHVQIHQDSLDKGENRNKFQCSLCPLTFDAAEYLKNHCFSTHYQGRHQCQLCSQKFVKKMHAYEHLKQGNLF